MAHTRSYSEWGVGFSPNFAPKFSREKGVKKIKSSTALSVDDIRKCARRHKEEWRAFLRHAERRARMAREEKIPDFKRGYLVFVFKELEIDLLLNLSSGEIYEISDDKRLKWILVNHSDDHPDERKFLEPADDALVLNFAEYTHKLKPRFVRELFDGSTNPVHPAKDMSGAIWNYHYSFPAHKDNAKVMMGVVVFCKTKPKTKRSP